MSKLIKATKRISAIAASALLLSSASYANVSNYASNFEKNGMFVGEVVVGSGVGADDSAAANVVINDLKSRYSGEEMVELVFSRSSSDDGGEVVSAIKDNKALNYGESIGANAEELDESTADMLEDGDFENNVEDVTYEQTLVLDPDSKSRFNYEFFEDVEGQEEITHGVFFPKGQIFATYTLDFKSTIDMSSSDDTEDEMIGGTLDIMGQEFTIGSVTRNDKNVEEIELLGGANTFSLSEGETQTVKYEGKSFEIEVTNVDSEGKVRLVVNGVAEIVERYDVKEVNGVDIAVIDSVGATGEGIVGAAEFIIGGNKITLGSDIKVNDDELNEVYPDYDVTVAFGGSSEEWDGFVITYKVDEDTLLEEGDSLREILLDTFSIQYDGTNEVEYSVFEIDGNKRDLSFSGELRSGDSIPSQFSLYYDAEKGGSDNKVLNTGNLYLGDKDYRLYFKDSEPITYGDESDLKDSMPSGITEAADLSTVTFDISADNFDDFGFFSNAGEEEQYLYQMTLDLKTANTDHLDNEINFEELMQDKDEDDVKTYEVDTKLEYYDSSAPGLVGDKNDGTNVDTTLTLTTANLGSSVLELEDGLDVDFSGVESTGLNAIANGGLLILSLNTAEVSADDGTQEDDKISVQLGYDGSDEHVSVAVAYENDGSTTGFDDDWSNSENPEKEDGSDVEIYVTPYGLQVEVDTDETDSVTVRVPDEQVQGMVNLVFGNVEVSEGSRVVPASQAEEEFMKLEDEGFEVEKRDVEASNVEFSVSAPVMDSAASGSNMIVVGGPAVNSQARALLGMSDYSMANAGVSEGEAVVRYFSDKNSVLAYGWSSAGTMAAVRSLVDGSAVDNRRFSE